MSTTSQNNILKTLEKLYADSRVTKHAHNIAYERKKKIRYALGIAAMVLSVFVSTGLIELMTSDKTASIIIKLLTFFSAVFAGALTFLNYEKEAGIHSTAVRDYANIQRSADFLINKVKDNVIGPAEVTTETQALIDQHTKANAEYQNCIPTNKDFDQARADMKAKDGSKVTPA